MVTELGLFGVERFTPVIAIDAARDYELKLGLNPNLLFARSLPGYLASLSLSFLFYCM